MSKEREYAVTINTYLSGGRHAQQEKFYGNLRECLGFIGKNSDLLNVVNCFKEWFSLKDIEEDKYYSLNDLSGYYDEYGNREWIDEELEKRYIEAYRNSDYYLNFMPQGRLKDSNICFEFYGAPGVGKSTMAQNFFEYCNQEKKYEVGKVRESATELIEKGQLESLKNQPLVTMMQALGVKKALNKSGGKVVSECGLELGKVYNQNPNDENRVEEIITKTMATFLNVPIVILHDEHSKRCYSEQGRVHNLNESLAKENEIKGLFEDKPCIYVSRYISMPELMDKIKEFCRENYHIDIVDLLEQRSEIKVYENLFPEPYQAIQELCARLGVDEVDNQMVWEKTIDYIKEHELYENNTDIDDAQRVLANLYHDFYADELIYNFESKLDEYFEDAYELKFDASKFKSEGCLYINSNAVYDIKDFTKALIDTYSDLSNKNNSDLKVFHLEGADIINDRVQVQREISDLLMMKFETKVEAPKFLAEEQHNVQKQEERVENQLKIN
ncbi:hypothetical protein OFO01_07100 [Campylobacter sp. JMF_01 NE2]|uniref:hypothetical protein n=1 Tax=unclassified Campylobacter TaxID=2593542 RepID=UPI0022E99938|nr:MULTISPECIES: hypothetical protein [unclassified Campylobacter]MDA3053270.1 hypothetical protein [Campylobacter sp. JMF_03 NE3]MDA3067547.1 hypothetical protein [Campylobacter sp. JMF_01 NE2]